MRLGCEAYQYDLIFDSDEIDAKKLDVYWDVKKWRHYVRGRSAQVNSS